MRLGYDELGLGSARCAKMQTQVSWDYWRIYLHARCMDNLGFSSTPEQSWGLQAIRQTRAGENQSARGFDAAGNAEKGVVRQRIVSVVYLVVGGVSVGGFDVDEMFLCNWWWLRWYSLCQTGCCLRSQMRCR